MQELDLEHNSIGYFFVFDILLSERNEATDERPPLLEKLLVFLMSFDPVQIRYVIGPFLALLERIVRGELYSVRKPSNVASLLRRH